MRVSWAVLAVLAVLAGCGALGEPPFAGLRAPDVAPWLDLGPVALCEGGLRIGNSISVASSPSKERCTSK